MFIDKIRKLSPAERLVHFVREREQVRRRRNAGLKKPWTEDEILQQYRFTNIRRMDDKVSVWILKNWYEPYYGHPNAWLACVIARHFNKPLTLERIGYPGTQDDNQEVWEEYRESTRKACYVLRDSGKGVFNSAYIISGGTGVGVYKDGESHDKIDIVLDCVIDPMVKRPPKINTDSMEESVAAFLDYRGMGSFMAGQVVADLRWHVSGTWADKMTWAPRGPGSTRGLCRFYGLKVERNAMNQREFMRGLTEVMGLLRKRLGPIMERLEAIDSQSILCEYDKYCRALDGDGKPKQKYPGRG